MAYEQVCRGCQKERRPPIEGPCPHCGGFYRTVRPKRVRSEEGAGLPEGPVPVGALLDKPKSDITRHPTGMEGVDHVFGGGLPEMKTVLFSGREGTGKTSFLMELLLNLRLRSLLLSTEQSKSDLIEQFGRFGAERLRRASRYMHVESETEFDTILDLIEDHRPRVLALDSLHDLEGIYDDRDRPMSSNSNPAACRAAKIIRRLSRKVKFFAFLIGHIGNDGTMLGGSHLRHQVDGTLLLDRLAHSDKDPRRILRFRGKVRFAPLGREALFQMTDEGFEDCGPIEDEPAPAARPKLMN